MVWPVVFRRCFHCGLELIFTEMFVSDSGWNELILLYCLDSGLGRRVAVSRPQAEGRPPVLECFNGGRSGEGGLV